MALAGIQRCENSNIYTKPNTQKSDDSQNQNNVHSQIATDQQP